MRNRRPLATVWEGMLRRCQNPRHPAYAKYGARGITVCERWQTFENFYADMGPRPSPQHSLDRINSRGHYEPSNCRWATAAEQNRNKRNNIVVVRGGKSQLLVDLCADLELNYQRVFARFKRGWSLEEAISAPPKNRGNRKSRSTQPAWAGEGANK